MSIIQVTRKQIQAANKAREALMGDLDARSSFIDVRPARDAFLIPVFTLTPRSPSYMVSPHDYALLACHGPDFGYLDGYDLPSLYASNRFFFDSNSAVADPDLDYADWNRWDYLRVARRLEFATKLQSYAAADKHLVLSFEE